MVDCIEGWEGTVPCYSSYFGLNKKKKDELLRVLSLEVSESVGIFWLGNS